jgi:hypothetical protein
MTVSKNIMNMKRNMLRVGKLSWKRIIEICKLEQQYEYECRKIAAQCEDEGYPSHGSNYELRCAAARKYYDEQIALIENRKE